MAEPAPYRPGVVPLVGKGVAAGAPHHVGMGLQLKAGTGSRAFDHPSEAGRCEERSLLADENEG
jgi:hypothetical protein